MSGATRDEILTAIRGAVEPHAWAVALWEGGSASFRRVDSWSDLDVGLAVEDRAVEAGFTAVESALTALGGIETRWAINPVTHVKPQRMYRLRGTSSPLVDVGVLPASTPPPDRFLERRRHGTPHVLFDRCGFTADVPADPAKWRERLRARIADLVGRVDMLRDYAVKSARRGEAAEAMFFYQAFTLRPLVELLRIRHDPWRHDFDVRCLRFDLPPDVRRRVYELTFVRDLDDLLAKRAEAEAWFRELADSIDVDAIPL